MQALSAPPFARFKWVRAMSWFVDWLWKPELETLLFRPPHPLPLLARSNPEQHLFGHGPLRWWMRHCPAASHAATRPILLFYLHGNGENLLTIASNMTRLSTELARDAHLDLVLAVPEYPGYFRPSASRGPHPVSERHTKECASAILALLRQRYPLHEVVLCGYSIGTGIATWLAAAASSSVDVTDQTDVLDDSEPHSQCDNRDCESVARKEPILCLILAAGFSSITQLLKDHRLDTLVSAPDVLHSVALLPYVPSVVQVIVVHGTHDELIGLHHAEALHDSARRRKRRKQAKVEDHVRSIYVVQGATHCFDHLLDAVLEALRCCLK